MNYELQRVSARAFTRRADSVWWSGQWWIATECWAVLSDGHFVLCCPLQSSCHHSRWQFFSATTKSMFIVCSFSRPFFDLWTSIEGHLCDYVIPFGSKTMIDLWTIFCIFHEVMCFFGRCQMQIVHQAMKDWRKKWMRRIGTATSVASQQWPLLQCNTKCQIDTMKSNPNNIYLNCVVPRTQTERHFIYGNQITKQRI